MASFQRLATKDKDVDPDLDAKSKRCMERVAENLHILANEPSLAFYRLQEHVRKALPPTVEKRADVLQLNQQIQGRCYDADYAIGAITSLGRAEQPFENAKDLLKNCIFFRQQLKYEESRKSTDAQERIEVGMEAFFGKTT